MNTNPEAKRILCYGDSNTWGDDPYTHSRMQANLRWTGVLQDELGNDYEVIEEGLCGRTFVAEEQGKPHRTGITHLKSILETHAPLNYIIVMLGTNDMKTIFNLSANDIANHLAQTVDLIQREKAGPNETDAKILIICPPAVTEPSGKLNDPKFQQLKNAPELSRQLTVLYKKVADENNCSFLNAGDLMTLENTDGYHMNAEQHELLAKEITQLIQNK